MIGRVLTDGDDAEGGVLAAGESGPRIVPRALDRRRMGRIEPSFEAIAALVRFISGGAAPAQKAEADAGDDNAQSQCECSGDEGEGSKDPGQNVLFV